MNLPEHVAARLEVPSEISHALLAEKANEIDLIREIFGLTGEEFSEAAESALETELTYKLLPTVRATARFHYIELLNQGVVECKGLVIPGTEAFRPPTAVGQALVGAWFTDMSIITNDEFLSKRILTIVAKEQSFRGLGDAFISRWAEGCHFFEGDPVAPIWVEKSRLSIESNGRLMSAGNPSLRYSQLFLEAVSEVKAKWRFLSLYRIFEHGYLTEIFQTLENNYYASPKESLSSALSSLESEVKQFVALSETASLQSNFEALLDEFEKVKTTGNQFANALQRSIGNGGNQSQVKGRSEKGVLVCYKIRCSIVHAGLTAPIFDAYKDGADCLEAILPICETAILQFLGATAT